MNKFYAFFTLVSALLVLVSYSANPPDGMTGAPGDSLCIECHIPVNTPINGEISVDGFPSSITPGQTYALTISNRNTTGDAVKGGFQMTILGPFNTRAGNMAKPSDNSTVTNTLAGRQYFEHNPALAYPDSNVIKWTVEWTAPELAAGSTITWYAAGNVANGDFDNTGDRIVTANGKGSIVLAATNEITQQQPSLYPNPGTGNLYIVLADGTHPDGTGVFYSLTGQYLGESVIQQGSFNAPELPAGVYVVVIKTNHKSQVVRWTKI